MRTICENCPDRELHHCKGDDDNCYDVMRFDDGCEAGYNEAIESIKERLTELQGEYVTLELIDELIEELEARLKL